jgi:uncharacterized RDD family membrane protein YckC
MGLHKRAWWAIGLGFFVVLSQVVAISLLVRNGIAKMPIRPQIQWGYRGRSPNEVLTIRESGNDTFIVFKELDLRSGQLKDIGLEVPTLGTMRGLIADKKDIWGIYRDQIIRTDGREKQEFKPQRSLTSPLTGAFLYQGQPAIVDLDDDGVKYSLFVLQNGEWHRAGEVALPGVKRQWVKNESTGQFVLQPGVRLPPGPGGAANHFLRVVAADDVLHLFYSDYSGWITAYREGFDLVPLDSDIASAQAPENGPAETTGWTRLDFAPGLCGIGFQRNRLVMVEQERREDPVRFWEKQRDAANQPFQMTLELKSSVRRSLDLLESPERDELYFIQDRDWNPRIQKYQDGLLQDLPQPWESDLTRTAGWLLAVTQPFLIVLLLANLILLAGSEWISRIQVAPFEHGPRKFTLASVSRRALARGMDQALILAVAIWHLFDLGFNQIVTDGYEMYLSLTISQTATGQALNQAFTWAGVVAVILILCQGRWGQTPGKWICGIQVLRSTSYRCGLARSLMRELIIVLDAPGITILPGIICLLLNDHRQRIGDLMADTVVVNVRELANADQCN